MIKKSGYLACALAIMAVVLIGLSWLPVFKADTPESVYITPIPSKSNWVPPHLIPSKTADPKVIWKSGLGEKPDNSTITLTVKAVGDPTLERVPVDVVLAIDASASMEYACQGRPKLDWVKDAACTFLNKLNLSGNDRVALVVFNGSNSGAQDTYVKLMQGYTSDINAMRYAINGMSPGGGTPLYDATVFSINYADLNHFPSGQTHPHAPGMVPKDHHKPVVILLTDGVDSNLPTNNNTFRTCINFITDSYNVPPPDTYWGYQTQLFTIGVGGDCDQDILQQMADSGGGRFYYSPSAQDIGHIYDEIQKYFIDHTAAMQPSPTESMITDVLPPYLSYQGSWQSTANNTARIMNFMYLRGAGGLWELHWEIPSLMINDVFEVRYDISSSCTGWQSVGVTSVNATKVYGSDYCKVKYQNYRYVTTLDSNDIWTNETNDVSIYVKGNPPDDPWSVIPPYIIPAHPPAPPGMLVPTPIEITISMPISNPLIQPLMNPLTQGVVQPQLMLNTMVQPMMNPVNMPNFVGLVSAIGMMEKIKVKRKMRSMRVAVRGDETASDRNLSIGE